MNPSTELRPPSSVFLVLNPSSRSFLGQRKWPRIFELFQASGVHFEYGMTEQSGDGTHLAAAAASAGYDAVVAVGGDGTINEVISGLIPGDRKNGLNRAGKENSRANGAKEFLLPPPSAISSDRTRFGVIYTGTSPDFCAFHRQSLDPEESVRRILSGKTRRVDLCRIAYRITKGGNEVNRVFSCSANFGLGAAIARGANSGLRKRLGDFLGTFLSMLHAVGSYRPPSFTVRLDGRQERLRLVHNLFVGKSPFIASGIKLQLDITSDDGRMFLVPLCGISKLKVLALLPRVYTGSICRDFPPRFCRTIEILDGGAADEVEFDGDPQGFLPARIEILPKALPLIE